MAKSFPTSSCSLFESIKILTPLSYSDILYQSSPKAQFLKLKIFSLLPLKFSFVAGESLWYNDATTRLSVWITAEGSALSRGFCTANFKNPKPKGPLSLLGWGTAGTSDFQLTSLPRPQQVLLEHSAACALLRERARFVLKVLKDRDQPTHF